MLICTVCSFNSVFFLKLYMQVAHCYTDELEHFPQELIDVLQRHHSVMDAELRMVSTLYVMYSLS